ncbi:MAG: type III-A CRISPR-associated RAMP protein Csm5 [bacterium]
MKTYKLKCEILSPLHIGAGDEIDPLNYIIKDGKLFRLSLEKYILHMKDDKQREEFEKLIDIGDLIKLRQYILENINTDTDSLYSIEVSPSIEKLYSAKLRDIQNQLLINAFFRTEGLSKPLIPGSSVKGAIRTAVVSVLAKKSNLSPPKGYREEYTFESKVLDYEDGKEDPFRGIKIKDAALKNDSMIVQEVRNVSRKERNILEANNIQIICEVTYSAMTGKSIEFEIELCLDEELFSTEYLSRKLTIDQIAQSCNEFYKDKMELEDRKFYKGTASENYSAQLLNAALNKNSFLLRIGRFSGVESVTLDNYRNPKPVSDKAVWGTTRNLIEGKYPLGWIMVTIE